LRYNGRMFFRFRWLVLLLSALAVRLIAKWQDKRSQRKKLVGWGWNLYPVRHTKTPSFWSHFFRESKTAILSSLLVIVATFSWSHWLGDSSYRLFWSSTLDIVKVPFEGTTNPVEKVPNWVVLTEAERYLTYDQLAQKNKLVALPPYNPKNIRQGYDWNNATDAQRNDYLVYSVPYLGNYNLDGSENSGSHPGVDMKIPNGTPIKSIANGVVYKVENQSSGFGKFITIAHPEVPDPKNPQKKTILFSTYAHLSVQSVRKNQVVKKGQLIGKSGNSGMSTAPHLHFQVDQKDAPFIPYWPFSWNDVKEAGYRSYFDGVRYGIGKTKAIQYTVNGFNFIAGNKNFSDRILVASTDAVPVSDTEKEEIITPVIGGGTTPEAIKSAEKKSENDIVLSAAPVRKPTVTKKIHPNQIHFESDWYFTPGEEKEVLVRVKNPTLVADNRIEIKSTLRGLADVSPTTLQPENFQNNTAKILIKTDSSSDFRLVASGDFGEVKSQRFKSKIFTDVPSDHPYARAIGFLKNSGVVKGYANGTFQPGGLLNRAEAVKIILSANNILPENYAGKLTDVLHGSWYQHWVNTAIEKGLVKGYPDKTFRPGKHITRAEFLKIALLAAGITSPETVQKSPYPDVAVEAWYAPYLQAAKNTQLLRLKAGGEAFPNYYITRSDAADILYRLRSSATNN